MALLQEFHTPGDTSLDGATVTFQDDTTIQFTAGSVTLVLQGSGFVYDGYGQLAGGELTGYEIDDIAHGGVQESASGLAVNVLDFLDSLLSPDPDATDKLLWSGNDTMIGSAGDDSLDGFGGADSIVGGTGNDSLDGGADSFIDTLVGGAGNDTYVLGEHTNDIVVEAAGGGVDTVISASTYTLSANVENLTLTGFVASNGTGNQLDNYIEGSAGANLLEGLAGNDTLVGGPFDTLHGGDGNDTYVMTDPSTVVEESPGGGTDTLVVYRDWGLPDNFENLVLAGTARIGSGNELANVITGNDLGDILRAGAGADTLIGGTGDDYFNIDSASDVVIDSGGNDTVNASASVGDYTLPDGLETLYFGGSNGTGNAQDNYIGATFKSNVLRGLAGNDTIDGTGGNDTIDGGDGLDHALFRDYMASFTVTRTLSGLTVSPIGFPNPDVSVLTSIERLDFRDGHLAFDITGNAGEAYRLYQAAFDRQPDLPGLGYQIHDLDSGVTLQQVAGNFIASPEFQSKYGNVDNTQFITLLYRNVLHREPDAGGLQFHLNEFAQGDTRANMLIHFSESPENQSNVIGVIQNGITYVW